MPVSKAISPARDRRQSSLLVLLAAVCFLFFTAENLGFGLFGDPDWRRFTLLSLAISLAFGAIVLGLRAATPAAAAFGTLISFLLTFYTGALTRSPLRSALTPLLVLFVLTFLATRAGRSRKTARGLAESRKGRAASQIVANLGTAALLATPLADQFLRNTGNLIRGYLHVEGFTILCVAILAALAEAAADTVSSEIGQAFAGTPILLTTLRRVPAGTDGAITPLGTLAGLIAAVLTAAAGAAAMRLPLLAFTVASLAAIFGLFFDSLLGATLERAGLINNDLVNLASTLAAALAAAFYLL